MKRVLLTRPERSRSDVYVAASSKTGKNVADIETTGVNTTTPHPTPYGGWGGGGDSPARKKKQDPVSLDSVLALVELLSAGDRKTLLARLALADQTRETISSRDQDLWSRAVYEELLRALGSQSGAAQGPALVRSVLGSAKAWHPVSDFMTSSGLQELTVTERCSVYGLLARLVVDYAHALANRISTPLGAKLVGTCSVHVASIFDNAFPGYAQAGLAPVIARQLVSARIQ